MSGFDPKAYVASSGKFDPKAYAGGDEEAPEPELVDIPPKEHAISDEEIKRAYELAKTNPEIAAKLEPLKEAAKDKMGRELIRDTALTEADTLGFGFIDEILNAAGRGEQAKELKRRLAKFSDKHPGLATLGSFGAAMPMSYLGGGWKASVAGGAASGLGHSEDKDPMDALVGGLLGLGSYGLGQGAAAGGKWLLGKGAKLAGKVLQKPQAIYEKAAEVVGRNSDEMVEASAKPSSGSKLQRELAAKVDAGELASMGPEVATAAKTAEGAVRDQLGDAADAMLDAPLAKLNGQQRDALMRAMVAGLEKRGLKTTADVVAQSFDELVRAAGKEPSDVTAREAMRLVNQRDPAFAQALLKNTAKRWGPLRQGMDVDPREGELLDINAEMLDDVAAGKQNRFNVRNQSGGKAQLPVKDLEPPRDTFFSEDGISPTVKREMETAAALKRLNERAPDLDYAGMNARDQARKQAEEFAERAAKAAEEDAAEQAAKEASDKLLAEQRAGAEAAQRLKAINAGKKRLDKMTTAASVGAMVPGVRAVAGPAAGALGTMRVAGSDKIAGAGRLVENVGEKMSSPESIAKSWLKNPSLLAPIAQRKDKLGGAARWVLDSFNEMPDNGKGFKSRLFILTMQPWFRAEVASMDPSRSPEPSE